MKSTVLSIVLVMGVSLAHASLNLVMKEQGSDIVVTGSGSLDLTGLAFAVESTLNNSSVNPEIPSLFTGPGGQVDQYDGSFAVPAFGSELVSTVGGTGSGQPFGFFKSPLPPFATLVVPAGYQNGNPLETSATFVNVDFDFLKIVPGEYLYQLPNDTISLTVVPEPAAWVALAGASAFGLVFWRRRLKGER